MQVPSRSPDAHAQLSGGESAPKRYGYAKFFQTGSGVLIEVHVTGLPDTPSGFFALHIHEGGSCGGEDFSETGAHFNPHSLPHPQHAGDLPTLLSCGGTAYLVVLTDRFRLCEVIGKTLVIHDAPDDFRTQPAGASGEKILCGVIRR